MQQGVPLQDEDRWPWLEAIATKLSSAKTQGGAVLACSSLKERYRQKLPATHWIVLQCDYGTILDRMKHRLAHFMPPSLLQSQFDALEIPSYGLHVDSGQPIDQIIQKATDYILTMKYSFGVIGLGVMGRSISLNIARNGHTLAVYNRDTPEEKHLIVDFQKRNTDGIGVFTELNSFISALEKPRKILCMIKAGSVVDQVIHQLKPLLEPGDVIIDGGNSFYEDTERRAESLADDDILFIGTGVSGGEQGALYGPSIMPGGNIAAYEMIAPVLESIAARDKHGNPCCAYVGSGGAGHYVKMIHNGIEYAEMQLLAEIYLLLKDHYSYEEIADVFSSWNKGPLSSYLLEITADIFRFKEGEHYLIDLILDKAGNKGTGSWSSQNSLQLGLPTTMMTDAVFARYISAFKKDRMHYSTMRSSKPSTIEKPSLLNTEKAYTAARILNHHQGFALIRAASEKHEWGIDRSTVASIWMNGCIIRSDFMDRCVSILSRHDELLKDPALFEEVMSCLNSYQRVLKGAIDAEIPIPVLSSGYQFWSALTRERGGAHIIQAQRDYFGAHTYQRIDDDGHAHHTEWVG